jgi:hypothetical protein
MSRNDRFEKVFLANKEIGEKEETRRNKRGLGEMLPTVDALMTSDKNSKKKRKSRKS